MIGSGIFTLPSVLAQFGGISLMGWLVAAIGAWILAHLMSALSKVIPETGGPYAYTKAAFGELPAFVVAWGFWLSMWSTNAAIALTFSGYFGVFFPEISHSPWFSVTVSLCAIWGLSLLNSLSIRSSGNLQVVTTLLKVLPILVVAFGGILFIDLDNFKQVNDLYGHLTGSSVLRQVGMEIKAAVRDIDSVLRYGGDEFVVVLIGANSRQAAAAAERVRSRVDGGQFRVEGSDKTIHVTTSIGVACCPDHGRDKATIIQVADETMYRAKNDGKNRVIMPRQSEHSDHITSINHHGRQP
jgi:diguanylate cyclase (GGDEF)-like protein